jgi:hypothetical protein
MTSLLPPGIKRVLVTGGTGCIAGPEAFIEGDVLGPFQLLQAVRSHMVKTGRFWEATP